MWPEDGSEWVTGYRYTVDAVDQVLPVEDVIHVRDGIDPRNERLGLAALKALLREVATDNEIATYYGALLRNFGVAGLAVAPKDANARLLPDDAKRIKEQFRDSFTGENRGDTVVLGGAASLEMVGFSPEAL